MWHLLWFFDSSMQLGRTCYVELACRLCRGTSGSVLRDVALLESAATNEYIVS